MESKQKLRMLRDAIQGYIEIRDTYKFSPSTNKLIDKLIAAREEEIKELEEENVKNI